MYRRRFLRNCVATSTASVLAPALISARTNNILKPQRLRPGSGVGLISPASAIFEREQLEIAIDAVEALELVPHLAPHILDRYGYLAGTDRDRAADLNRFFAAPQIDALMPLQGGWGSSRILPYLDYDTIRQNPKILVGFSDITALLLGIYAQTGLVTFHGPHGLTGWRSAQTELFHRVLFAGDTVMYRNIIDSADEDRLMQVEYRTQTLVSGRARGKLIGGNLSVMSAILGTPYFPRLDNAILFIEDIGESIYRIDRLLTHLKLAGALKNLSGFIFGQCSQCTPGEGYGSLTLTEVIRDHIAALGIPAWYGAQIGHVETVWTLPIGATVEIDADLGIIRLLESAVV